jgi:hypothetical protein
MKELDVEAIQAVLDELARVREERDRLKEACERIAGNLCFCQALDSQDRPCDPCVAKGALEGRAWVITFAYPTGATP